MGAREEPVPAEAEQHQVLERQQVALDTGGDVDAGDRGDRHTGQDHQPDQGGLQGVPGVQDQPGDRVQPGLARQLQDHRAGDGGGVGEEDDGADDVHPAGQGPKPGAERTPHPDIAVAAVGLGPAETGEGRGDAQDRQEGQQHDDGQMEPDRSGDQAHADADARCGGGAGRGDHHTVHHTEGLPQVCCHRATAAFASAATGIVRPSGSGANVGCRGTDATTGTALACRSHMEARGLLPSQRR